MLIIHPKDKTTRVLSRLYEGLDIRFVDQSKNNTEVKHILNHTSQVERIMLLGHGSDRGLFSKENDEMKEFNRLIISHQHAFFLRKHGGNIIGIWCHAEKFAREEGLHGLFSGMIISEKEEADEYNVSATQEEIDEANEIMFSRLRRLLDTDTPLYEIPKRLKEMNDKHSPITDFNYKRFFFL